MELIYNTTSLCSHCKNGIPAKVVDKNNEVWMLKECSEHGEQNVRITTNAKWFRENRDIKPPKNPPPNPINKVELGCPFDCGSCEQHEQQIKLPVVTITSACNLDCPICFVYNKNENAYFMTTEEFEKVLKNIQNSNDYKLDLINFTGGDPTMHPKLLDFIELAQEYGIHRVSICTNGIKLAKNDKLVARLKELDARIALSFDSFEEEADFKMQGEHLVEMKMQCLDMLEKHDVDVSLIPVMTRGLNDHEVAKMIDLMLTRPNIRNLEFHTMTYTGQGGVTFDPERRGRISIYEVLECIENHTKGFLKIDDFVPSPCAHSLCYQIAYLLIDPDGGPPIPFTRFLSRETLYDCLGEHLYIEPTPKLEMAIKNAIDELWQREDEDDEAARILKILKKMLKDMFPKGREITIQEQIRISEKSAKAVYIHSHMDEETFDTEKIVQCCDSNCYPDGQTIPVCVSNILYRPTEEKFTKTPEEFRTFSGGQLSFTQG